MTVPHLSWAVFWKDRKAEPSSTNKHRKNTKLPITAAARSKAWTVFARSNAEILGSNPTQGMDICVRLFCVKEAALRRADPPSKESYRPCIRLRNWKSGQGITTDCRAIDRQIEKHKISRYIVSIMTASLNSQPEISSLPITPLYIRNFKNTMGIQKLRSNTRPEANNMALITAFSSIDKPRMTFVSTEKWTIYRRSFSF
jgi:hypothetical protein